MKLYKLQMLRADMLEQYCNYRSVHFIDNEVCI